MNYLKIYRRLDLSHFASDERAVAIQTDEQAANKKCTFLLHRINCFTSQNGFLIVLLVAKVYIFIN